jgi:hypothetical protein
VHADRVDERTDPGGGTVRALAVTRREGVRGGADPGGVLRGGDRVLVGLLQIGERPTRDDVVHDMPRTGDALLQLGGRHRRVHGVRVGAGGGRRGGGDHLRGIVDGLLAQEVRGQDVADRDDRGRQRRQSRHSGQGGVHGGVRDVVQRGVRHRCGGLRRQEQGGGRGRQATGGEEKS